MSIKHPMPLRLFLIIVGFIRGVPFIHRSLWKARKSYNAAKRRFLVRRPVVDGNDYLKAVLKEGRAYAAGKMGSIETQGLWTYLKRRAAKAAHRPLPSYAPYLHQILHVNAGVFPENTQSYDDWAKIYLSAVKQCDMLVSWDVAGEANILGQEAKDAMLVGFRTFEPFFAEHPWTAALEGKRVLVVSPFAGSIARQYLQREMLWDNADMLPAFALSTLKAPLSAGIAPPVDASWQDAYDRLSKEMDAFAYDVALIGAGAFSLPLVAHAKARGKIGIHLGGSLQMLFGVAGERWKRDAAYRRFIKESWVRPSADETPGLADAVEKGCYW